MTRVRWEIDVDPADPVEAARDALEAMRDVRGRATVFTVETPRGDETVDLEAVDEDLAEIRRYGGA